MWFLFAFGQAQATTSSPPPPPPRETGSSQAGICRNDQLGLIYYVPIRVKQLLSFAQDEKLVKEGMIPPQQYLSLEPYGRGDYAAWNVQIRAFYDQSYANSEDAIVYVQKEGKFARGAAVQVLRDSEECIFDGHKL